MATYKEADEWYHKIEAELSDLHNMQEAKVFDGLLHPDAVQNPQDPVPVAVLEAMIALERALFLRAAYPGTPPGRPKCS